jgi:hypothetical protein
VVTTTDLAHVPGADEPDVVRLRVEEGAVVPEGEVGGDSPAAAPAGAVSLEGARP